MEPILNIVKLDVTKEKLEKCFTAFNANISDDADLMLDFIAKKIDLEIEKKIGFNRRRMRYGQQQRTEIVLKSVNSNLIEFTQEILENSFNNKVDIQAIRKALRKLCPLWPIC